MAKEQEFLYIVHMASIGNAINLPTQGENVCDHYTQIEVEKPPMRLGKVQLQAGQR
ncbi:hypothetical protein [Aeromonas veronii]|uniref:hypothetical protein n=1 Tax=Aeromonas veronii TaxID=654 RepID=UPI003B9EFC41